MELVLVGVNHRTSSVDLRERLAMDHEAGLALLRRMREAHFVAEGLVLSTCNRVEIYALAHDVETALRGIPDALAQAANLPVADVYPALAILHGREAVEHLFSVTSSLDSLVIGEPQILGQVKQAYAAAQGGGLAGGAFNRLVERAFSVAKRVRSETQISRLAVSVSSIAVDLARKIFGRLDNTTAMLVGAGEMAELAARHFNASGIKQLVILNRTYERAVALAQEFQGVPAHFDRLHQTLGEVDIAVFSAGATHYLLRPAEVAAIMKQRKQRPLFLIDIAVPRNIDPACADIESVFVYDIDDLEQIADDHRMLRTDEAALARSIVGEETEKYIAWKHARQVFPVIARLTARSEAIRRAELERTLADLQADPLLAEKLEAMTSAIIRKMLHHPIQAIRAAQIDDDVQIVEAARRIFALEEESEKKAPLTERKKA
jgi:glutamyl-tRNA reductase